MLPGSTNFTQPSNHLTSQRFLIVCPWYLFSQFRPNSQFAGPLLFHAVSAALHHWIVLRKGATSLVKPKKELVKLGLARFGEYSYREAYIDEPLVLLAAADAFENTKVDSLGYSIHEQLRPSSNSVNDKAYEAYIGYYLACAFDGDTRLCDIFDFGEKPPKFAEERAELVSIAFTDHGVQSNRFNLLSREGAPAAIGVEPETGKSMVEWLRNPTTLMCFSYKLMGPDIVLFIRVAGVILTVLLQYEWASRDKSHAVMLARAKDSVNIWKLFQGEARS